MSVTIPEMTLPEEYEYGFSYEYGVDININDAWQRIRFISNVAPTLDAVTQDAQTYEDKGSPNAPKVGESWSLAFFVQKIVTPTGVLPEVKELLSAMAPDAVGKKASRQFRWYDNPASGRLPIESEAFSGIGTVNMTRAQTGADGAIDGWNVVITGQGRRLQIANPANTPAP